MDTHKILAVNPAARLGRPGLVAVMLRAGMLALSATVLAGACGQGQASPSYFPLGEGNAWVYVREDVQFHPTRTQEVKVTARTKLGDHEVFLMNNYLFRFAPSDVWLFSDSAGNTAEARWQAIGPETGPWYLWSDPTRPVKLPDFVPDCFHGSTGRFISEHTLSVPAGTFENVRTIEYDGHPCIDSAVLSESFAPGVGLIQRRILTFHGEELWSLQSAVVNGKSSAAASPAAAATTWGAIKATYTR